MLNILLLLCRLQVELVDPQAGSNPGERVMFAVPTILARCPQEVLRECSAALPFAGGAGGASRRQPTRGASDVCWLQRRAR